MRIPYSVKQQKLYLFLIVLAVIGFAAIAMAITIAPAYKIKQVIFNTEEVEISYGDTPDFSAFSVCVVNGYGNETTYPLNKNNVSYDPERIGTQDATVSYKKNEQTFKLTISARQLETPQIRIVDGIVEWNEIPGADSYIVSIGGSPFTAESNRYDLSNFPQTGTLRIQVSAEPKAGDKRYIASEFSQIRTLTKLGAISNLRYENGAFVWDEVETTVGYSVTVNGETSTVPSNRFPFDRFQVGENTCTVYVIGDDYHWAGDKASCTLTKLAAVENVTYDWSTGKISWEYGSGDAVFKVRVNDELVDETYNLFTEYELVPARNYRVSVTANGQDVLASDTVSKFLSVTKLDKPVLNMSDGTLSWSAVPNVQLYEIGIDNVVSTQSGTSISLNTFSAGAHEITVKSYSAGGLFMSSDSATYSFTKLADVTNLVYDRESSVFSWNAVADALKYEVSVNDTSFQATENSLAFTGNFSEGANQISVTAVTKNANDVAGASATLTLYKYQKVRNVFYLGSTLSWEDDNVGCSYKIDVEGTIYTTTDKQIPLTISRLTKIRITAYSDAPTMLDSDTFMEDFTAMTLSVPTVTITPNVRYANSYDIKVTPVSNATNYSVTVYVYATENGEPTVLRTFTLDSSNPEKTVEVSGGPYKLYVEVVATDSNGNYNDSPVGSAEYRIKK